MLALFVHCALNSLTMKKSSHSVHGSHVGFGDNDTHTFDALDLLGKVTDFITFSMTSEVIHNFQELHTWKLCEQVVMTGVCQPPDVQILD